MSRREEQSNLLFLSVINADVETLFQAYMTDWETPKLVEVIIISHEALLKVMTQGEPGDHHSQAAKCYCKLLLVEVFEAMKARNDTRALNKYEEIEKARTKGGLKDEWLQQVAYYLIKAILATENKDVPTACKALDIAFSTTKKHHQEFKKYTGFSQYFFEHFISLHIKLFTMDNDEYHFDQISECVALVEKFPAEIQLFINDIFHKTLTKEMTELAEILKELSHTFKFFEPQASLERFEKVKKKLEAFKQLTGKTERVKNFLATELNQTSATLYFTGYIIGYAEKRDVGRGLYSKEILKLDKAKMRGANALFTDFIGILESQPKSVQDVLSACARTVDNINKLQKKSKLGQFEMAVLIFCVDLLEIQIKAGASDIQGHHIAQTQSTALSLVIPCLESSQSEIKEAFIKKKEEATTLVSNYDPFAHMPGKPKGPKKPGKPLSGGGQKKTGKKNKKVKKPKELHEFVDSTETKDTGVASSIMEDPEDDAEQGTPGIAWEKQINVRWDLPPNVRDILSKIKSSDTKLFEYYIVGSWVTQELRLRSSASNDIDITTNLHPYKIQEALPPGSGDMRTFTDKGIRMSIFYVESYPLPIEFKQFKLNEKLKPDPFFMLQKEPFTCDQAYFDPERQVVNMSKTCHDDLDQGRVHTTSDPKTYFEQDPTLIFLAIYKAAKGQNDKPAWFLSDEIKLCLIAWDFPETLFQNVWIYPELLKLIFSNHSEYCFNQLVEFKLFERTFGLDIHQKAKSDQAGKLNALDACTEKQKNHDGWLALGMAIFFWPVLFTKQNPGAAAEILFKSVPIPKKLCGMVELHWTASNNFFIFQDKPLQELASREAELK